MKAMIVGCSGLWVSEAEKTFFRAADPYGFILFERNCRDPNQVRALVADLRACVGRADAPVLIDQEGGRVARLKPPHWRTHPAPSVFDRLARTEPETAIEAARLSARLIANEVSDLGITINCAPVLDVPQPDAHSVIGDRAAGTSPEMAALLGRAACEGFLAGGVLPVIKHIPGHGRACVDSHKDLPVVDASLEALEAVDFAPFRALRDMPWAMSAHVVYRAVDPAAPATTSARVIGQIIRGSIGFDGVLVSDDLSMKALGGGFEQRAADALSAGCDLVLHCNGVMAEMEATSAGCEPLNKAALARLDRGERARLPSTPFEADQAAARLNDIIEGIDGL